MDLGFADAVVVVNGAPREWAGQQKPLLPRARVALLARGEQGLNDTAARLTELGAPDVLPVPPTSTAEPISTQHSRPSANAGAW